MPMEMGFPVLCIVKVKGLELFSDLTVNLPGGYGLKTQEGICKR